ncbi:hypothetical protein K439DRAFT_482783 [Ramaria rubella]|nr:hypothetical protein K439DRAFT_482783 [Ramaria rubella]
MIVLVTVNASNMPAFLSPSLSKKQTQICHLVQLIKRPCSQRTSPHLTIENISTMYTEPRSPSPVISEFSTPMKNPLPSAASPYLPSLAHPEINKITILRIQMFAPCCDRIRNADMMLTWTHNGEQVWLCRPAYLGGQLYAAHELPLAFEKIYLKLPECPCAMQETDPMRTHNYNIWVVQKPGVHMGKIAAACTLKGQGCASWCKLLCDCSTLD